MTKQHGGYRPGSGRKKGSPNRTTSELGATLAELAREHTQTALDVLVEVATNKAAPEAARVSAANSILDRGYGKPKQDVDLGGSGLKISAIRWEVETPDDTQTEDS